MIDILSPLLRIMIKPVVLHSLPGRLRLHIPYLKKISHTNPDTDDVIAGYLDLFPGITSVKPNFITGNALIQYDAERITEQEIMQALKSATAFLLKHRELLKKSDHATRGTLVEKLKTYLANGGLRTLLDEKDAVIPDVIWKT